MDRYHDSPAPHEQPGLEVTPLHLTAGSHPIPVDLSYSQLEKVESDTDHKLRPGTTVTTTTAVGSLGSYGEPQDGKRKRSRRWLVVGVMAIVLLLILVIAVVAGVLGARNQKLQDELSQMVPEASSRTSTANPTTTAATATASGSRASSATPSASSASAGPIIDECPDVNLSQIQPTGADEPFVRECGVDYPTQDITHRIALSMQECVGYCVELDTDEECVGVTWEHAGLQGTGNNFCWLKRSLPSDTHRKVRGGVVESAFKLSVLNETSIVPG